MSAVGVACAHPSLTVEGDGEGDQEGVAFELVQNVVVFGLVGHLFTVSVEYLKQGTEHNLFFRFWKFELVKDCRTYLSYNLVRAFEQLKSVLGRFDLRERDM